jgi:hypothetical protein
MIWKLTGNSYLDSHVRNLMAFDEELSSDAYKLTTQEKYSIKKSLIALNKVLNNIKIK